MRRNDWLVALLWILLAACMLCSMGILLGGKVHLVSDRDYRMLERYAKLESVRRIIEEEYYQETDDAAMMDGAIMGMLAALDDPYTFYYTPKHLQLRNEQLSGVYHGVGLLLLANKAGEIEAERVYRDGPAHAAGMMAGDIILAVDGEAVNAKDDLAFDAACSRITGADGTAVRLTIRRNGEYLEIEILRGGAVAPDVAWSVLEDGIGYISILQFHENAAETFREGLQDLIAAQVHGLIIDLRGNPGGIMEAVVDVADEILPEGLIVCTETRNGVREEYRADGDYCALPLAVLINEGSASASEVLAAAVQDSGRGVVVGEQSFGKGIVQAMVEFTEDGSGLQYTYAQYFTSSGRSVHEIGVTPDIVVAGDVLPNLSGKPDPETDEQLLAALHWLQE